MRDRRLLIVAVALALVFSIAWFWRAAGDGVTTRVAVAEGSAATVDGVSYRLESLRVTQRVPSGSTDQIVAVNGATLVIATVRYDSTAQAGDVYCSLELVAGDASWEPDRSWDLPEGQESLCESNKVGTVSAVYEVPQGWVDRVQGVGITNLGSFSPLLLGKPR